MRILYSTAVFQVEKNDRNLTHRWHRCIHRGACRNACWRGLGRLSHSLFTILRAFIWMRIHNYVAPCERFDILHLCYICFLHLKGRAYRFGAQVLAESHVTCIDFPVVLAHFDWCFHPVCVQVLAQRLVPPLPVSLQNSSRQLWKETGDHFSIFKKTFNLKSSSQTGN